MIDVYSFGICCLSVCSDEDIAKITESVNTTHPTGIQSQWAPSEDKTFHTGESNPCQCKDHTDRKHYLFNC